MSHCREKIQRIRNSCKETCRWHWQQLIIRRLKYNFISVLYEIISAVINYTLCLALDIFFYHLEKFILFVWAKIRLLDEWVITSCIDSHYYVIYWILILQDTNGTIIKEIKLIQSKVKEAFPFKMSIFR